MPDSNQLYVPPRPKDIILVLLAGLIINGLSVLLAWVTATYLIAGPICGSQTGGVCAAPFALGYNIFLILGGLVATAWFAYGRVFRPALVTLAPVVIFWSLPLLFTAVLSQGLIIFGLINALLIAFSYLVFYWLVRVNNFLVVFILWLAVVLGVRLFLVYY